tara:strand:+ start:233 stop:484 length:252 start_codon:yes stop_codon:yes gene_type:complete
MKYKIILPLVTLLIYSPPSFSDEIDCTQFKKLSAKYIECNAAKLKEKTNKKVKSGKEKFDRSVIKDKFKKFKESKTLSDLIKD